MSVQVKLSLDGGRASAGPAGGARIRVDVPISQCISEIVEKTKSFSPPGSPGQDSVEYGIFAVGKRQSWLSPKQTVSSYDLSDNTVLELRCLRSPQKVLFDDGTHITLTIDRSKKVVELTMEIAEVLGLASKAHTYGLRRVEANDAISGAAANGKSEWLHNDQALDNQGLTAGMDVIFAKRVFNLDPACYVFSDADVGFAYLEARRAFLSGKYDSVLNFDLVVELAAPLLVAQVRVQYSTPVPILIESNSNAILPPTYRKRSKRDKIAPRLTEAYRRLSASLWVLDIKNLKSYFLQTMLNVPTFGISTFEADVINFSTSFSAVLPHGSIQVCSHFVAVEAVKKKKHHEFLSLFGWAHTETKPKARAVIPLDSVVGAHMDQGVVTISIVSPIGVPIEVNVVASDAIQLGEMINSVVALHNSIEPSGEHSRAQSLSASGSSSRRTTSSSSNRRISLSSSMSQSGVWISRSLKDTLQGVQDTIKTIQNNLRDISLLKNCLKKFSEPSVSDNESYQCEIATQELANVRLGFTSIQGKVQSGEISNEYSQRSIDAITSWCSSIEKMVKCILSSAEAPKLPQNLQAVADATYHFLALCVYVLGALTTTSSQADSRARSNFDFVLKVAIDSCAALDLVFQGHLCDGLTAASLSVSCNDIQLSFESIVTLIAPSGEAVNTVVAAELDHAKLIFQCDLRALLLISSVYQIDDKKVTETVRGILDGMRAAANSLVGAAMIRSPLLESQEAHADRTARLRHSWGCLDHTIQNYAALVKLTGPPTLAVDNRLPPIVLATTEALHVVACSLLDSTSSRRFALDSIADAAAGLQRTLKTLGEKFPTLFMEKLDACIKELQDANASSEDLLGSPESPSAMLNVLPLFVESMSFIRNPAANLASALKQDLKILITAGVVYRSALLLCGTDIRNTAEQAQFIRQAQEQLDVLIREVLPPFVQAIAGLSSSSVNINSPGLQGFDAVMTESIRHMKLIFSALEADAAKLGTFGHSVFAIKKVMSLMKAACLANVDLAFKTKKGLMQRDSSKMSVRRTSTRRLQMMRTSSSIFARVHPLSEIKEEIAVDAAVQQELLSESIFLKHVEKFVLTGSAKYTELTDFKEALDVYVTTFPYWTSADTFMARIVPLLVNPDSLENIDINTKVVSTLCRLMKLHPRLVEDSACRILLNRGITFMFNSTPPFIDGARALEDVVASSVDMITRFNRILEPDASASSVNTAAAKVIDLMTVDLRLLAEQITVVEQKFFQAVSVADLLNHNYDRQTNSLSLWIQHTNALGRWFASRILQQQKPKQRAKLILRIFKLADLLRELKNYSVVITIYATLSGAAISRLSKTWDISDLRVRLFELGEMIQPLRNFARYREEIKALEAPCIPYMAVLTRDLICLEEVMSATMMGADSPREQSDSSMTEMTSTTEPRRSPLFANMKHMVTVSRVVSSQFTRFRRVEYQLRPDPKLFPELYNPSAYELFAEEDMLIVANCLEPSKRTSVDFSAPSSISKATSKKLAYRRSYDSRNDSAINEED